MKLALIGFGAMGQLVAGRARGVADEIGLTLTSRDAARCAVELAELLRGHDAAIDFSAGSAVLTHVEACARGNVALIEGTRGWNARGSEARLIVAQYKGPLVAGANFSVGVNVFYRIAAHAAALFQPLDGYTAFIEEAHHSRKRDAPSGTALRLRDLMKQQLKREIPIASTRAGYIPGTHRAGFDSEADQIMLTHTARNREGFAAGALMAAHWIAERKGVFEFSEVIDEILKAGDK